LFRKNHRRIRDISVKLLLKQELVEVAERLLFRNRASG